MFHTPTITESVAFTSLTDRIRRTKYLIPVSILVVAYTAAILAIVLASSKMKIDDTTGAVTTKPPEQGVGGNPTTPPPATDESTLPPAGKPTTTSAPGVTTTPAGSTTKAPSTPAGSTTTGASTTTKAPTSTPASGTTKAPSGPSTAAPPTTTGGATTTKAPTSTTKPPTTTMTPTPTGMNVTLHPPAELGGKRGFCFRNSCSETIWIGQIGAATGIKCGAGCPAGTICNPNLDLGCYFSLPFPASKVKLAPGEFFCLAFNYPPITTNVFMPDNTVIHLEVQWSGAVFASTGCDDKLFCETGVCKECTTTECHECPSYRGPVGPVAQAELTLSGIWKDYYDTTLIHGANLPLVVKPMTYQTNFWPDQYQKPAYHCGRPGSPYTVGDSPGASWNFKRLATQRDSQVAPALVYGGSKQSCAGGKTCPTGEVCGVSMSLNERNQPTAEVGDKVCGKPAGIWSRSELCGWTDSWAYADCKTKPDPNSGTMQQLYKCDTPNHESCFQPISDSKCCGCTVWPDFVPTFGEPCKNHNPVWEAQVMPHLEQIKRACPTCYTFPYDDSTALFTCWDDELWNAASYEFEWCPAGLKVQAPTTMP